MDLTDNLNNIAADLNKFADILDRVSLEIMSKALYILNELDNDETQYNS